MGRLGKLLWLPRSAVARAKYKPGAMDAHASGRAKAFQPACMGPLSTCSTRTKAGL